MAKICDGRAGEFGHEASQTGGERHATAAREKNPAGRAEERAAARRGSEQRFRHAVRNTEERARKACAPSAEQQRARQQIARASLRCADGVVASCSARLGTEMQGKREREGFVY